MSEPEWVDALSGFTVADEAWFLAQQNGNGSNPHDEEVEDSWQPRNLADLADQPPVQPTLGGLGLVYPGKRHVFSGPQESAKTLAAYVIGLAVVRAGSSVVLIDFEMGPWDAKTRLRELGASDEDLAGFAYVAPETKATAQRIDGLIARSPDLVLVDAAAGAYDLQELDDNKRADVERFTRFYVNGFWKAGIATIVLDHVTKNAETRGNYAIGSERKVGGADVHLGFSVVKPIKRGEKGVYQVMTHKDRGGMLKRGHLADFKLLSDPDTHQITWEFAPVEPYDAERPKRYTVKMEQASRWLERQMEERVPMSHIEQGIGGNRDAGRAAIETLLTEGYFREDEGPRNARLITVVRPYREEFDDLSSTSPDLSQFDTLTTSPLDSAPRGAGQPGEVSRGMGEVTSPEGDGIPF